MFAGQREDSNLPENLPEENVAGEISPEKPVENIAFQASPEPQVSEEEVIPAESQPEAETTMPDESPTESVEPVSPSPVENVPPFPKTEKAWKWVLPFILVVVLFIGLFFLIRRVFSGRKPQQVTLNYWGLWEEEAVFRPLIEQYQQTHPNIKINYVKKNHQQYRERLQYAFQKPDGPDIFRFHNTWVPMLKNDLAPVPKDIFPDAEMEANFYPVVTDMLKLGDYYYGIPLEIDGLALFYNEDIFKAAGVAVPKDWDTLRNVAINLTVPPGGKPVIKTAGVALGSPNNVEHWSDILGLMMFQNGATLRNPTDEAAEVALRFFHMFVEEPNKVWDETLDNSILAFAQGKVAMIFAPSWQALTIREINPRLNFKTAVVPQIPGETHPIAWASFWAEGIWQKSKYKKEAFEFLKFLTEKENMLKLYTEEAKTRPFGEPFSRVDLATSLTNDPYLAPFVLQGPIYKSWYLCSRTLDNGINDRVIKYYEDALNSLSKGASPKEVLETVKKGLDQTLSQYGL